MQIPRFPSLTMRMIYQKRTILRRTQVGRAATPSEDKAETDEVLLAPNSRQFAMQAVLMLLGKFAGACPVRSLPLAFGTRIPILGLSLVLCGPHI